MFFPYNSQSFFIIIIVRQEELLVNNINIYEHEKTHVHLFFYIHVDGVEKKTEIYL
jgi:hypothetical protein